MSGGGTTAATTARAPRRSPRQLAIGLLWLLLIAALTGAVYAQVRGFDFLTWDDPGYVSNSTHVRQAFSLDSLWWSLTHFYMANWHPLTLWSHKVDVALFGFDAGAHHLMSVAWHIGVSALVYALVRQWGGSAARAGWVALLFAVHPLHVESVVWVSERKDLLCAFFWLLALLAYGRYVVAPGVGRYLLVSVWVAAALMAKPMAVTLPATLLLLDLWIYRRAPRGWRDAPRLLLEKAPWLLAAAGVAWLTIAAQQGAGAFNTLANASLADRLGNATVAYVTYLGQSVVPVGLRYLYELSLPVAAWQWLGAAIMLLAVTGIAWRGRQVHPWGWVGWLWFLGTLVPVIGLLQVGVQARADRYMYLPLLGLLLMLGFWPLIRLRAWQRGSAVAAVVVFAGLAWQQTGTWRSSETLYRHALASSPGHCHAREGLANELINVGKLAAAGDEIARYRQTCTDAAMQRQALLLASKLARHQDDHAASLAYAQQAMRRWPADLAARVRVGGALMAMQRFDEALAVLLPVRAALMADYHGRGLLGEALLQSPSHAAEALAHYQLWAAEAADDPAVLYQWGVANEQAGRLAVADQAYRQALTLNPQHVGTRLRLARLTLARGDAASARAQFDAILTDNPGQPVAQAYLDRLDGGTQ